LTIARLARHPDQKSNDLVTEDFAAQEFAAIHADRLRYCHDTGAWFEWSGAIWRKNRTGLAFQWSRELARDLAENEPDKVRYVSSKTSFASGVERFARVDPVLAVTSDFWDRDPYLLGTPGGTVDLRTGKLGPANPRDGITKATAVTPAIVADCPTWLRFLHETTGGDAGLIRFLQQFAGYSLTGDTKEHALIFGYGPGGNGKSVYLNTVAAIIADYAATAAMDTFAASVSDKHPTDLPMLRGARLVTCSETEEGRAWAEAKIKQIMGGDRITARFMRQVFFTFTPNFKLFIIGNHKPILKNVDDAARRRFCIVPFTFKPERPDRDLEAKRRAEWPGILRWMIEGALDWQRDGLVRPQKVLDATAEYFGAQEIVGRFLEEECDFEPGNRHKTEFVSDLFEAWSKFAKANGEAPGSAKSFTDTLQKRGIDRHRTMNARLYRGVRLRRRPPPV
jgi:putative DNA primase/helicase